MNRGQRRWRVIAWQASVLVGVLALWEAATRSILDPFSFSRPSSILALGLQWVRTGYLPYHLLITLEETLLGFVLGAAAGLTLGVLLGLSQTVSSVLAPFINALYSLPKVALGPLLILWFGIAMTMKVILAAILAFFLVFYNTWSGVREVDVDLVDTLRVMGARPGHIVAKVIIPSALTWVFTGLRVSVPQALIGSVIGEIIASNRGLGYVIEYSAGQFNVTGVFVALLALMIISIALDAILAAVERRFGRWRAAA